MANDGVPKGRIDVGALLKRAEQAYSIGDLLRCEVELTLALRDAPDDASLHTAVATIQKRLSVLTQVSGQDTIIE